MNKSLLLLVSLVVGLAACGGGGPAMSAATPSPTPSSIAAGPSAGGDPTPTQPPPTPTATAAANVATPEPEPSPAATTVREYVRACKGVVSEYSVAALIVTVVNSGNTWIKLDPGSSDYTVYSTSGNVTTTGSFLYAYPKYLAPGQVGYLADDAVVDGAKPKQFKKLETDVGFSQASEDEVILLEASKIKKKRGSFGRGRTVTGLLHNASDQDVDQAHVGAFYMNAKGQPIGFSYTNLVQSLEAGETKGFSTVTTDCQPSWKKVKKTVVLAGDDNF